VFDGKQPGVSRAEASGVMRAPIIRGSFLRDDELIVDSFAGGGGASTGIEAALGRPIDIAINHSPEAIAMHQANHPNTRHFCESVWKVDPVAVCGGRKVGVMWLSPDCTHFSKAKGGKPKSGKRRGLAWLATRWAKAVRPRVIFLENVEEFETWGPLDENGQPDVARAGRTFKAWLSKLRGYGYTIEFRTIIAADHGTPTLRKRLFLVARCDGESISWPAPTHGKGRTKPWVPASSIIDWSLPCPSIFGRKRALKPATMRRIAEGVRRYVVNAGSPFIVPVTHTTGGNRAHSVDSPLRTVTTAKGGEFALVSPTIVKYHGGAAVHRGQSVSEPLRTVDTANRFGLVAALITKHYGGVVGHGVDRTLGTVTSQDHHSLTAAFLTKFQQNSSGQTMELPLHTVMAGATRFAEVRAFLVKYYGTGGQQQDLFEPLHTVTTKARFGLVMVHGEPYEIVDIGMRMLAPHELFAAQGFPSTYEIAPEFGGKRMTKTTQIALAGNSVCPMVAEAIVAANLGRRDERSAVA
jgi:DNA (cytosine-5)-methyltransferase 1